MKEFFKGLVKDRQSILKTALFGAFILAETAIYIAFIAIQVPTHADPIYLKYAGILLCVAVSASHSPTNMSQPKKKSSPIK